MKHLGTVTLNTQRLVLRRVASGDIPLAFKNWTTDEKVTEYLSWQTHSDISVTNVVFKSWLDSYAQKDYYHWAIVLKSINEPIGTINFHNLNESVDSVEVGYCIGSRWWNKGIVTEALNALIKFFFEEMGGKRLVAAHHPQNIGSGRVMQKCGLSYEGTLRQSQRIKSDITDSINYSILACEYKAKD